MHRWLSIILFCLVSRSYAEDAAARIAFADELAERCWRYFDEQTHPVTGLVADRAPADGGDRYDIASIASTGFGLTALCIAADREWVDHDIAYERTLRILRFLRDEMAREHGFYYHFVKMDSGQRAWNCELSSIDTALLMAGVITTGRYFAGTEVERIAEQLYADVDWNWMLAGGETLSMGWTPEHGFLGARWDGYSEHPMMYLIAVGAPKFPAPPETWYAWRRQPMINYGGRVFLACPPLFTHQYSQAWVDFRSLRDAHADYYRNSILATLAQQQMCADLADEFPAWSQKLWGLTASDSIDGYKAWGGPPPTGDLDGTIVPNAPGGSIPFAPDACLTALQYMKAQYGDRVWKRYGFVDAFNPHNNWTNRDVIGISVGVMLLMAVNHRDQFVWRYFMGSPHVKRGVMLAGLIPYGQRLSDEQQEYLQELAEHTWRSIASMIDTDTALPYDDTTRPPETSTSNIGLYLTSIAAARALDIIDESEAKRRARATIRSVIRLPRLNGFRQTWHKVATLEHSEDDSTISVLDSANLAAGLLTVGGMDATLREATDELVEAMQWDLFYDPAVGLMRGGYDRHADQFVADWYLGMLATDARLAVFLAIAAEDIPAKTWQRLDRSSERRQHAAILRPAWEGGGLFMQYLPGTWLDERQTMMGRSAANFAYAQIRRAQVEQLPVWGWSACASPSGEYLGWGELQRSVVTPHASVLAVEDFSEQVIGNLHALETMGARLAGRGFADSIDLNSNRVAEVQLLRNQAMLLSAITNAMTDGQLRQWFGSHPMVQHGEATIAANDSRRPSESTSLFALDLPRDDLRKALQQPPLHTAARPLHVGWEQAEWSAIPPDGSGADEAIAQFALAWDEEAFHLRVIVEDDRPHNDRHPDRLYEQDSVEFFIDPAADGLKWGNPADFQYGFAIGEKAWEWFGQRHESIDHTDRITRKGYMISASIPWSTLGLSPKPGLVIGVDLAVRDADQPKPHTYHWHWQPRGQSIELGRVVIEP